MWKGTKLLMYMDDNEKFEWFYYERGNDQEKKVVPNTFLLKKSLTDYLTTIFFRFRKRRVI